MIIIGENFTLVIMRSVKIIQYCSILFILVFSYDRARINVGNLTEAEGHDVDWPDAAAGSHTGCRVSSVTI